MHINGPLWGDPSTPLDCPHKRPVIGKLSQGIVIRDMTWLQSSWNDGTFSSHNDTRPNVWVSVPLKLQWTAEPFYWGVNSVEFTPIKVEFRYVFFQSSRYCFYNMTDLTDHVVECRMKVWRQDDVIDLEKCQYCSHWEHMSMSQICANFGALAKTRVDIMVICCAVRYINDGTMILLRAGFSVQRLKLRGLCLAAMMSEFTANFFQQLIKSNFWGAILTDI